LVKFKLKILKLRGQRGDIKMSFGIKPLGERVVIKRLEAEEKTQSGIVLPGQAKEQPQMAEVVAVGPGTKEEKMELKPGDTVVFSKYAGTEIKYKGEEYTIMSQKDILATVTL
jgi:chaperonin GroES